MKKYLYILISAVLMTISVGCSKDEDDAQSSGTDNEVLGGIVWDYDTDQITEGTDSVTAFFKRELHSPYWDGNRNEHKTFFEAGYSDSILVINSQKEFQKAYMGILELPYVDFNQYTLIIGRTWGNDGSYELTNVILNDKGLNYELETKIIHYVDRGAYDMINTFFYWRLYPKLSQKNIIIHRTVIDV